MSTQLNLGASYLVNDFYRRFIKPSADQKHYLLVSRLLTILLMVFSGLLVFVLESAKEGFSVILTIGAGTGLIYLLRWFWWRINAWSEIAAMVSSFLVSMAILLYNKQTDGAIDGDAALICTVAVTSIVWIIATLFTRPESRETLTAFVRHTQPAGPGWRSIRAAGQLPPSPDSLARGIACWLLGCAAVYTVLFGSGCLLFERPAAGFALLAVAVVSGGLLFGILRRRPAPLRQAA